MQSRLIDEQESENAMKLWVKR